MGAALILTLLSATPARYDVAVLVTSERRLTSELSTVVAQLNLALAAEGVETLTPAQLSARSGAEGFEAARRCQGDTACAARFADTLKAVVISVDAGKLGKTLTVQLDAIAPGGAVLVSAGVSVPVARIESLSGSLAGFAVSLAQRLPALAEPTPAPAQPPPPVSAAPAPTVAPQPSPLPPPPTVSSSTSKVPWLLGASAAAGAVVSVVFGVLAGTGRARWDASLIDSGTGTLLTPGQATSLARDINTQATVAIASGALALALLVAAVVSTFW